MSCQSFVKLYHQYIFFWKIQSEGSSTLQIEIRNPAKKPCMYNIIYLINNMRSQSNVYTALDFYAHYFYDFFTPYMLYNF